MVIMKMKTLSEDIKEKAVKMRLLTKEDFKGYVFTNINSPWDVLGDVGAVALRISEQEIPMIRHPLISNSDKKKMIIAAAASTSSCRNFMEAHNKVVGVAHKEVLTTNKKVINAKQSSRLRRHCDYDIGVDKFLMMNNNINYSTTSTRKRSRNPKSLADQEYDGGDTYWEEVMQIKKKKKKKIVKPTVDGNKKMRRKKKKIVKPTVDGNKKMRKTKFVRPCLDECPDLPERFRQRIEELNGRDITLVIQKPLFSTDLSRGHDRLSIPFAQIITWDNFLTPDEKALLSGKKTIAVPIIDPKLDQDSKLIMVQWDMEKESGKTSHQYALRSKWYKVVEDNQLKKGQVVQVWSFRVQNSLHIALVVISNEAKELALDDDESLLGINLSSSSSATAGASSSSAAGGCGSTD